MKKRLILLLSAGALALNGYAANEISSRIIERTRHTEVVERTTSINPGSQQTNRYTVLSLDLNRPDGSGGWVRCEPRFDIGADGNLVGTGANYTVKLNAELATQGAVELTSSRQEKMRFSLIGVDWFDPDTGRSVLVGTITNSTAEIIGTNRVIFRNAVTGLKASVVYEFGARFSQWVVLEEKLSPPAGFGPRTRLEALTEIVESPAIAKKTRVMRSEKDAAVRASRFEADLTNDEITFGEKTRMGAGQAFLTDTPTNGLAKRIPVYKNVLEIGKRKILVESIEIASALEELNKLPTRTASAREAIRDAELGREIPEPLLAQEHNNKAVIRTASNAKVPTGFALDYEILDSYLEYYSFSTGDTYWVQGYVYIYSPYFANGAFIKYNAGASIEASGYISFPGDYYAVFTSVDDHSVGTVLSSNSVSGYYANPALYLWSESPAFTLAKLDIRYAQTGVTLEGGNYMVYTSVVSFSDSNMGLKVYNGDMYIYDFSYCNVNTPSWHWGEGYGGITAVSRYVACDKDFDQMSDLWEMQYFGNLSHTNGSDEDGDGLINLTEFQQGLNPTSMSSKNDGMIDEVFKARINHPASSTVVP